MIFTETPLRGAFLIEPERIEDERGFFARSWCAREFEEHHLEPALVQCNISFNERKGTVRGMHYQAAPHGEAKLVRCTRGRIYDVVVDIRPGSPTYLDWFGVELGEDDGRMLYVPQGLAHGFQTLENRSEVFYQMSEYFVPSAARGVRWDDPAFCVRWPRPVGAISSKDASYPDFVG
jgi:dTDP-4-dehydrorhamnose 3,5-epimerase